MNDQHRVPPLPPPRRGVAADAGTDEDEQERNRWMILSAALGALVGVLLIVLLLLLLFRGDGSGPGGSLANAVGEGEAGSGAGEGKGTGQRGEGAGAADKGEAKGADAAETPGKAAGESTTEQGAGTKPTVEKSTASSKEHHVPAEKPEPTLSPPAKRVETGDKREPPEETSTVTRPVETASATGFSGISGESGSAGGGTKFFGVRAKGSSFVYLVDCSGSMSGAIRKNTYSELTESIERLVKRQKFCVMFYGNAVYPMDLGGKTTPKLVSATPSTAKQVREWINSFRRSDGTEVVGQALSDAVALKPDVIYLLTDGQSLNDSVVSAIGAKTSKKTAIYTVRFGRLLQYESLMKRLAEENRGQYRVVP